MAELIDGLHLNTFVAPELLQEFKNYKDDFVGVLPGAPVGAINAAGLLMNKLINNVGFVVNNQDVFTPTKMDGKKGLVEWDKLDTKPTAVDDAEIRALAFDKRAIVRIKHSDAWKIGVRDYILRKLSPVADAPGTPVIRTTGNDDGNGRKRLTYADLIKFTAQLNLLNLPNANALNLVLCPEHSTDLMLDKASTNNYREGIVIDNATGALQRFYKVKIWENNQSPIYTGAGSLKSAGAEAQTSDRAATLFFYADNAVYHVNDLKIIYKPETIDTRSADPTSEYRLQSYALCARTQNYGFGALVSGII